MNNFYEFTVLDITGQAVNLSQYQGKLVLIVNVASHCGFTKQYSGLEKLYQDYQAKGLVVLGFPCNQFAGQEPGTEAEILQFCQLNYQVTFPMFSKVNVNGPEASPLFNYLKDSLPDVLGKRIKWNFTKFLVDRSGQPLKRFAPTDTPEDLEKYLSKII
jgi:glutathione peroxidase